MAQIRKMTQQNEIKCSGDVHFQLYKYRPHELSKMCPFIKSCELVEGQWGSVGSIFKLSYNHDGKVMTCKEIIIAIDNHKKLITFKVIEGDIMMLFNSFEITFEINKIGTKESVLWTIEYEKKSEDVADPNGIMDLLMAETKNIETYYLN